MSRASVIAGLVAALVVGRLAGAALAAPRAGLVFDDRNGDGRPQADEPGVAGAVVALGARQFVVTDARGGFALDVAPDEDAIAWVRVPSGFAPGPVWAHVANGVTDDDAPIELALRRLAEPPREPFAFVVAADTHISPSQPFTNDLAQVITDAAALEPPPAFVTILGDITQGAALDQFELVDRQLADIGAPYVPVPGNHDWYDGGAAWFAHYGPDNYSFDIAHTHFVVWNLALSQQEIRDYLGAELAHVPADMAIVALTHAPPSDEIVDVLRALGVDYVLTGHSHTNRVVDHDGVIELNHEPLLMGGLDFTPGGYRVMTIDRGALAVAHHTVVDRPVLALLAPGAGCAPSHGGTIVAAAARAQRITARVDCAAPIALRFAGGWSWQAALPALAPGVHTLTLGAGAATSTTRFAVCEAPPVRSGAPRELAPPLTARWAAAIGGHALQATPAIADGVVYVTASDLGDGARGGVVAIELATGAIRWRATTGQVRSGAGVAHGVVAIAQLDGTVIGLDAATGRERWRNELGVGLRFEAGVIYAPPTPDAGDFLVGNQRRLAALASDRGVALWTVDPVPDGANTQSLAAIAIGDGLAVGAFHRDRGGLAAWDRATGRLVWRIGGPQTIAINTTPVIADGMVYLVNGSLQVLALELATGIERWRTKLDPAGFDWGNAAVGAPALARGVLLVPTLYRDLVALDAATGLELWRHAGAPSPLRTTHYRGAGEPGFEASPVITGDIAWAVDTAGVLTALELRTGAPLWRTALGVPVLGGLATTGDWLVVASYDGTVRGFAPGSDAPLATLARIAPPTCDAPAPAGCCSTGSDPRGSLGLVGLVALALRRRRR